jgi:hypothetical protein
MLNQCFKLHELGAVPAFREEGRGLGFSIGGWHPFRINTYLPTLKKLDPLANTAIGKAVWKPIEKVNQTVNKDFAKAKKWSQEHRKQLQIAAAIAAAAVGGAYAMGYLGTSGSAAAAAEGAAAVGAGESVTATTFLAPEVLTPIVPTAGNLSTLATLAPEIAPTVAASGSTFSVGSLLGSTASIAKDVLPLMALSKALSGGQQPTNQGDVPFYAAPSGPYGSSYGGGGGALGPLWGGSEQGQAEPGSMPSWILPAAGIGLLIYLISE